ncbi:TRAP transporter small permease [Rhizobium ruizarguesonis]|uniref:TRAP transporter small permease n=1 Tax=Rhizobium ruizarguesonis TaxID=2081791 RepID=UPI00102FC604|nr:TRAP transporter small permease [Rhizobium ruizarguesonis]TBA08182.1 TRAP transporter small permease [Rhizobium ruizarguesonis]
MSPSSGRPTATASTVQAINVLAGVIVRFCRVVLIVSGIALTVVTTANVLARYAMASGGFSFAQELPMLIFPWFILSGIVLAAHAGGHMAVEWIYDKLGERWRIPAFCLANAISAAAFLCLGYQATIVAEIAGVERSPVLQLPNSIGYYALAVGSVLVSLVILSATARVFRLGWEYRTEVKAEEMPV